MHLIIIDLGSKFDAITWKRFPPVTDRFPSQGTVIGSSDVSSFASLDNLLNNHSSYRDFGHHDAHVKSL